MLIILTFASDIIRKQREETALGKKKSDFFPLWLSKMEDAIALRMRALPS